MELLQGELTELPSPSFMLVLKQVNIKITVLVSHLPWLDQPVLILEHISKTKPSILLSITLKRVYCIGPY